VKTAANQSSADNPSPLTPDQHGRWVVFQLDAQSYALPLNAVERVVRAVYVTPLALAPPVVLGVIDVAGQILPVFSLRRRLQLPERPIAPTDEFLITRTLHRRVVLQVDAAKGLIEQPIVSMIAAANIAPDLDCIRGVIAADDGLVLIHDLEQLLSPDEATALDKAMNQSAPHAA
jgi:purine-binding chemotaxis protein CheW